MGTYLQTGASERANIASIIDKAGYTVDLALLTEAGARIAKQIKRERVVLGRLV